MAPCGHECITWRNNLAYDEWSTGQTQPDAALDGVSAFRTHPCRYLRPGRRSPLTIDLRHNEQRFAHGVRNGYLRCMLSVMPSIRALARRLATEWYIAALGLGGIILALLNIFGLLERYAAVATLVIASAVLVYVVRERSESLDEIKRLISAGKATVFHDRDQLYDHLVRTLADETYFNKGPRRILHAALHGTDHSRVPDTGTRSASLRAFDEMMNRTVARRGKNSWSIRTIYTVVDESRLEMIVRRLEEQEAYDKYEVKALIVSGYAPVMPLVVGDQHTYLALDDPRYYRAGSGMYIEGKEAASLAAEYFNRLWDDPRAYFIRRATGVDRDAVNAIRALVSAASPTS